MFFRVATEAVRVVGQEIGLAEEDRRRVLHAAGCEVRDGDQIELPERVSDGVVGVVELQDLFRRLQRDLAEVGLVRRRADANRHAVLASVEATEIADRHRHQV